MHHLYKTCFELQGEGILNDAEGSVNMWLYVTQRYAYGFKNVCENEVVVTEF